MTAQAEAAVDYGKRRVPVFPVKWDGSKEPLTAHGFKDATTDDATIRAWWGRWQNAWIGMPTGNGMFVFDVDVRAAQAQLESEYEPLPKTRRSSTPREGEHVYQLGDVGCATDWPLPGIDIRGDGGYVVLPPSPGYRWTSEAPVVRAPVWLLNLWKSRSGNGNGMAPPVEGQIPNGNRNATLTSLAGTMRRRGLDAEEIAAALLVTNSKRCQPPLPESDVLTIAASVGRYAPAENGNVRRNGHRPDRYLGRHVDLAPLLAAPPKPVPWRVWDFVADGTVTVLSGESGAGKSWLAQAMCLGVARGDSVAGIPCAQGRALYVDAEMGPEMFVDQRLRQAGMTTPEFEYIDAMGLDVSKEPDLDWIRSVVVKVEATLVVIDSLRRLVPSQSENDSDDMAPTVSTVAKLARDTRSAIVLIHHKGDSEKFYRGSTAIRDQADALFALLREDDDDDSTVRRLRCRGGKGKMRYALEPEDVYLTISPFDGGVAECDAPAPTAKPGYGKMREYVKTLITEALPAKTKTEVSVVVGRPLNDRCFREAWVELERDGSIVQRGGSWVVVISDPRGEMTMTTPERPATPEEEELAERLFYGEEEDDR